MPVERNNAEERLARLERLLEQHRSRDKSHATANAKPERHQLKAAKPASARPKRQKR